MKSLWLVSLLFLLAAGCVSIKPKGLIRDEIGTRDTGHGTRDSIGMRDAGRGKVSGHGTDSGRGTDFITRSMSGVTLYKATLDIRKHHLTGLLVIKRMDTDSSPGNAAIATSPVYRIVFANEIGMTYFDLELKSDSFKVISCFESLNKKALMKIFETDVRLLTGMYKSDSEALYIQSGTGNRVVSTKAGKYSIWQTFAPAGDTLYATNGKSNMADPTIISYSKYADGLPARIQIENPFIGMTLLIRLLDRKL
jgi:hypothetical protein